MEHFNEPEWLKLIFLLSDTQEWIDEMAKDALRLVPIPGKKKFLRNHYPHRWWRQDHNGLS